MGLIGNILANSVAGGLEGAGEGVAKEGELAWKDEHERMKQEATAMREERNIALQGGEARKTEATKPVHVAPGATVQRPGQPDFTASIKMTDEERAGHAAYARRQNAEADSIIRGDKAKNTKPTLPKIVPLKDEMGNVIAVLDENTGAVGTPRPGAPAKDAISHWFSANEPAKPAVPAGLDWVGPDRQPIAGIHQFYPDMVKRGVGAQGAAPTAPAQSDPLGLRASLPKAMPQPTQQPPSGIVSSNAAPKALPVEQFLTRARGGFVFQASPRSSDFAKQLNGRSFRTAQEAQDAYDALMNQTG